MRSLKKIKLCIYCMYCYPLFNQKVTGHFGGWEVRIALVAKELAKCEDFEVTLIVADHGQPHVEYYEGVRLVSWVGKEFWTLPSIEKNKKHDETLSVTETKPNPESTSPSTVGVSLALSIFRTALNWFSTHLNGKARAIVIYLVRSFVIIGEQFFKSVFEVLKNFMLFIKAKMLLVFTLFVMPIFRAVRDILKALKDAFLLWDVIGPYHSFFVWQKDIMLLDEINADVYIVPGNHTMSAITASYANKLKKKYIFLAGSDMDYYPEYAKKPRDVDIYGEPYFLKSYAIERADLHIVQSRRQSELLSQGYGRSSVIIHNPIDLNNAFPRKQNPNYILWVGTSDERVKRPALIYKLARQLPDRPFVIIMRCLKAEDIEINLRAAAELPNVTLHFDIPFTEIEEYFAGAKLFVSTSAFEGFPNTFLQASKYGVPIIALDIDPGEMLSTHRSGITCMGDFENFVGSVSRVLSDASLYSELSANTLRYVREHHEKQMVINQYKEALMSMFA